MSNARTLADLVSTGGELADGQISVSEISDLTATAAELNTLDGITATVTELNTLDGATSSIQDQLDNISVTSGSLTKTFTNGEQASITLSSAISPAPIVSVTKEVAQTGVSSKGGWDVATDGSNYELHDTAYDTTLTPGTIGFDLENASYDSISFSVAGQEIQPTGLTFNNDGTKLFIIGSAGREVNEYSLSTAYDITTASFTQLFSVSAQDTAPEGLAFNTDGTKMFVVGSTNDRVYEYALTTGFDVSTASYTTLFSVSAQDTVPTGITFNNDGTKMYISGGIGQDINEYILSTAFDISTASFNTNFSTSAQEIGPRETAFNSDGTKMYIVGTSNDTVFQYSLSTAFDISTASYDSVSFSVNTQETTPHGLTFNNDGTKMYVVGYTTDTVYQYSTSKDALLLGSGSFASTDVGKRIVGNGGEAVLTATDGSYIEVTAFTDSSTIASGDWSMFALTFDGTDGVKIGGAINGFDLSVASYDSVSFSVSSQESAPSGVTFNNEGTKMYIVGVSGDDVNEYALSTAFDVSTATFTTNFSVSAQDTSPEDIAFNNDGTKMFILGGAGTDVNQYALSTAYDISTATYTQTFSVSTDSSVPLGLTFNNDGTKMYIGCRNEVNQYTLSSAFDVSTAAFSGSASTAGEETTGVTAVSFSTDGTKMFVIGETDADIFQYNLSSSFDILTASYSGTTFSITSQDTDAQGLAFNSDGTKMYVVGDANNSVYQYSTGTAFTPTSQYHPTVTKTGGQIDTSFWLDINTMTADETLNGGEVYYAVSTDDRTTWAVIDDTDGVRNIVRDNAGTWQYNDATTYGGTTWVNATTNDELYALQEALEDGNAEEILATEDTSLWTYDSVSFDISSQSATPQEIKFNDDGTKMYLLESATDSVFQYSLSTAYDLSTASYDSVSFSVASQNAVPKALAFNNDGTKMYMAGQALSNTDVYQYTLSTGFDVSTASYDSVSFRASNETIPGGMIFNNDGTKMYIVGSNNDDVRQYSLSTAFDLSTASYDSVALDVSGESSAPSSIAFNSDGSVIYVVGQIGQEVNKYSLSTAFDLSTASYEERFSTSSQDTSPAGIMFSADYTKMYLLGATNDTVFQYSSSTTSNLNRMNSTQLNAVTDPNHYTLGNTLDLAIMLYTDSAGSIPESDGVTINYDAEALNQGAVVGTDYDFDFPDSTTVRITSNAAQNLKIRVV